MFYHLKPWQSWQVGFFSFIWNQGIQTKNSFHKIFNLNFDLGPLKGNTYCVRLNQFCKGLSKGII